jgi:UDP-3-O-acyl N-acetylglucosamine deacetylase
VKQLSQRPQRTLARPAEVRGVGYLTGADVRLRFLPASPSTGVVFVRTDVSPAEPVPARIENVTGTHRRTTLGQAPACVTLVEHVLAALAGLRIDNCTIEIDAPEPPGLDGSAGAFVDALCAAGALTQRATRAIWGVEEPVVVENAGATLALHPANGPGLRLSYHLDYGDGSPVDVQRHTCDLGAGEFRAGIARCRTFLLEAEAEEMRRQGIGRRTRVSDLLVFGPRGPIENRLRYADEPARHKLLDIVGDLSLLGHDLCGHVVAYRSGHPLNAELVRALARRIHQARNEPRAAAAA